MAILRTDIERALDDLIAHQDGFRFQGLAVAIGKRRWTKLIARPRKKDGGLETGSTDHRATSTGSISWRPLIAGLPRPGGSADFG